MDSTLTAPASRGTVWGGRILTGLAAAVFAASALMKLTGGPAAAQMGAQLGIPAALLAFLPFLELACVALYLLPRTAPLGAALLTAYLGGAVFAHVRVGDAFVAPVVIGGLVWVALTLRDASLAAYLRQALAGR